MKTGMVDEQLTVETIPLAMGKDGVIRVSKTRVTLDTIVDSYNQGETPEEIAEGFPTVPLADIYQVIGYYLRHAEELKPYFEEGERTAAEVRVMVESHCPPAGLRERLLARRRQ